MTNLAGNRIAEFDTSKYGEVYHKHSLWRGSASPNPRSLRELFDGRASHIGVVTADPSTDITRIELVPGVFFPEDVLGAVLRATNSESAATAVVTEVDPNGAYIQFDDPNGAVADIVGNDDGQFLIWDNRQTAYTGYPTTGGTWTSVEAVDDPEFGMRTILHAGGEDFAEFMVGWQVQIDAAVPVYLDIVAVDGELLYVSGDVSALVTAEETEFCIIHPVGVNPQNGATQTNPCQPESRYLWGGGYYLPPIAGFEMDHEGNYGIHGNQPGQNKSGQHYMWNRRFDIDMGRWTTLDPARSPWWNLHIYGSNNPITRNDPTGLAAGAVGAAIASVAAKCLIAAGVGAGVGWLVEKAFNDNEKPCMAACTGALIAAALCIALHIPGAMSEVISGMGLTIGLKILAEIFGVAVLDGALTAGLTLVGYVICDKICNEGAHLNADGEVRYTGGTRVHYRKSCNGEDRDPETDRMVKEYERRKAAKEREDASTKKRSDDDAKGGAKIGISWS